MQRVRPITSAEGAHSRMKQMSAELETLREKNAALVDRAVRAREIDRMFNLIVKYHGGSQ